MIQQIACPNCATEIPIDAQQLLEGKSFSCNNCNTSIGLAKDSNTSLQDQLKVFSDLKKEPSGK